METTIISINKNRKKINQKNKNYLIFINLRLILN